MSTEQTYSMHSRRSWLQHAGCGFGWLGLQALLSQTAMMPNALADGLGDRSQNPLSPREPHFPARAKRVVWIFVNGGPSQVDTWDYKPGLEKADGKSIKEFDSSFSDTTGFFRNAVGNLMKSPFEFTPRGKCGKMVSSIFPHLGEHVDKMAFVHSMHTDGVAHGPATLFLHSGAMNVVRPSMGAWTIYGLGSENENLPGFISIAPSIGTYFSAIFRE